MAQVQCLLLDGAERGCAGGPFARPGLRESACPSPARQVVCLSARLAPLDGSLLAVPTRGAGKVG